MYDQSQCKIHSKQERTNHVERFCLYEDPFDIPAVLHGLKDGILSTFLSNDASDSVKVRLADELNDETSFLNFRGLEC